MKDILVGLTIVVIALVKLVFTGLCLAIGFRVGGKIYDLLEAKANKSLQKPDPQPAV